MDKIERFRGTDGTLIAYVWPGGYPVAYLTAWDNVLCPKCANAWQDDEFEPLAYGFVHWEGSSYYCDECSAEIESAYGDPEAEEAL